MRVRTALLCLALAAPARISAEDPEARPKLLDGMGTHHRDVGTKPEAQRFFDQGLVLTYGFNHAAAERSFREAARLDPSCAMCSWGIALVQGPHINAAMTESAVSPAWEASQEAKRLAKKAKPADRALIEALTKRYSPMPGGDRAPLDQAYADAMRDVAKRFPDDADVQTLAAESLMDLHPFDLWEKNGTAKPWTGEIVALLERAISLAPQHPGANHFYIHAVEASKEPQRAMASADRLRDLVPGAGHLVHMPAHVFIRTGRYWDAVLANRRAIDADRKSAQASCHGSLYAAVYVPHNVHFLWAAAAFAGAGGIAVDAAKLTADGVDLTKLREPGLGVLQHYWVTPLYAWTRFGHWDEILAMPEPEADLVYPRSIWRWARGVAHVRQGDVDEAAKDLAALEALSKDPGLAKVTIFDLYDTSGLVAIAREHLAGELAFTRGEREDALAHLRRAVAQEDALQYDEPPPWPLPMRHVLGAMLLDAQRPAEAEAVYRADLEIYPENGWSLRGLSRALAEQGKPTDAAAAESRFQKAWAKGDFELDSSRL